MRDMGLAKIYMYTKFEVSSSTHSRFMEAGLKYKKIDPDSDHTPFGGILMRWDLPGSTRVLNLKFSIASSLPKIRRMCHAMAGCVRVCAQTSA